MSILRMRKYTIPICYKFAIYKFNYCFCFSIFCLTIYDISFIYFFSVFIV
nr:MAG TPA: hypothetical protein [Caudoviricetes sp.]